jgi:hypothetical protein
MQQSTVYVYKLKFNNGKKLLLKSVSLTKAHKKIVSYMIAKELTDCLITCPNGVVRSVKKTGNFHPVHNGFLFN